MDRDRLDDELDDPRTPGDDGEAGGAGDRADDQEEREPQLDEAQGEEDREDEDGELTPEQLKAIREENRRLRETNRQLTRMKSNYEELREEYDDLLDERSRGRRRPEREADEDEDDGGPDLTAEEIEAIRENPAIAKAFGVLSQRAGRAIARLKREVADVRDRATSRIPLEDEGAVDRLMKSGEFTTRRAAHLALQGIRARKNAERGRSTNGQVRRPERPAREPERPPVATTRRGLTPRQRQEANVVTIAEHRRRMDRDGPGYDPKYVERYRNGQVKVTQKR